MKRYILGISTITLTTVSVSTQERSLTAADNTTPALSKKELRKQRVARRDFHCDILGDPSHTPDLGALIGGSALITFRMNPGDTIQLHPVLPVSIAYMFEGGINLTMRPRLFFRGGRFRIFRKFVYKNTENDFYGIGYSMNKDYIRNDSTSRYRYSGIQINPWLLLRLGKSDVFADPQVDINCDKITNPARHLIGELDYVAADSTAGGYKNFNSGLGFFLIYDNRDILVNACKSVYFDFRGMMCSKALGSDNNFYRLEMDYRQCRPIGRHKVPAWIAQSRDMFGSVPLTQYPLTGTPFNLCGYCMGQHYDKSSRVITAEYRQMINTGRSSWMKRMLYHIGFVTWTGCDFIGPTMGRIRGVLPNYGVGLRIEVQPRVNTCLNLGKNAVNSRTLFCFSTTEAF